MHAIRKISGSGLLLEDDQKLASVQYTCSETNGFTGSSAEGVFQLDEDRAAAAAHNANAIETATGSRFSIFVVETSGTSFRFIVRGLLPEESK